MESGRFSSLHHRGRDVSPGSPASSSKRSHSHDATIRIDEVTDCGIWDRRFGIWHKVMTLNYRDLRQALTEFDRILHEGRTAGWDDDAVAEKTALLAARRVLAEIDGYLRDHLSDIDDRYGHPAVDG